MLTLDQTKLDIFSFGENEDDTFYILINTKINPEGVDLKKLSGADPRFFDAMLNAMGCILMLNQQEVDELAGRRELDKKDLHTSIYNLAKSEGIIK